MRALAGWWMVVVLGACGVDSVDTGPVDAPLTWSTSRLDFGAVAPASTARRTVTLRNRNRIPREVTSLAPTDARFVVLTPLPLVVPARGEAEVEFDAQPTTSGPVEASLSIDGALLALVMNRTAPCLEAQPLVVPPLERGCRSADQRVRLTNTCAHPVSVRDVSVSGSEFALVSSPRDAVLGGGSSLELRVALRPQRVGSVRAGLQVTLDLGDRLEQTTLDLTGEGTNEQRWQQTLRIPPFLPSVDLLLVLDDTAGMERHRASVEYNLETVRRQLIANGVELRVGMLTTSPESTLRALPSGALWTDGRSETAFRALASWTGTQPGPSSCLESLTHFANGPLASFHRPEASLFVVCVTNQPDAAPGPALAAFTTLRSLLPPGTQMNVVARQVDSPWLPASCGGTLDTGTLSSLATFFQGREAELCEPDWSSSIAQLQFPVESGYRTRFSLLEVPDLLRGPLRVELDGVMLPEVDPNPNLATRIWKWDGTRNELLFDPLYAPEPGSTVRVEGIRACP